MKKLTALLLTIFLVSQSFSQTIATTVDFNKKEQAALMLELPYEPKLAEDFIIYNLKKTGYQPESSGKLFWKQNKVNGYYVFKGVKLDSSAASADLYFKVEAKNKRLQDRSVVYLLIDKGETAFVSSNSDLALHNSGKAFMDGFVTKSAAYKQEVDVLNQEDAVKMAEKKLEKLKEEEKKLADKLQQIQNDVKQNKEEQEAQAKAVENEKRKLSELKTKSL